MKKSVLKLPKLKTRDELLRTAPELGRFLAAGEPEGGAAASPSRAQSPLKRRARSPTGKRPGSPRRLVRRFSDDEITPEERVRAELERVKQERATLLESLAKLRADQGKSGGELQQEDIRLLRRELEAKKDKLNELRRATHELAETLEQLETTSRDCEQLMPQAMETLQSRVTQLTQDLAAVEQDILEAQAKHELYKLLEIRTRREHSACEQKMREARALKEGAMDDFTTLSKQMHEMRAAKEDAERELGAVVMMYDQVRSDWHKKLKDRRKEVRELERRKAEDAHRKEQQAALAAEEARIEQERTANSRLEHDAAKARLSTVVPQLEALEATWARMHGVSGTATADDLIAYWQELKAKEANMRELVRLAEVREARAKEEVTQLLAERAEVFDSRSSEQGSKLQGQKADEASQAVGGSGEAEATVEQQAQADEQPGQSAGAGEPAEAGEAAGGAGASSSAVAVDATLAEAAPKTAGQAAIMTPEAAVEQQISEKQEEISKARRRRQAAKEKFAKLSQVCVAADQGLHLLSERLKAAMEAAGSEDGGSRGRSITGGRRLSINRSMNGQRQVVRRMSAANLMERRASICLLPVPGEASARVPVGSSINDKEFFPELPSMLRDVSGRLNRLMLLVEQLQSATQAVHDSSRAEAAQRLSGTGGESSGTCHGGQRGCNYGWQQ